MTIRDHNTTGYPGAVACDERYPANAQSSAKSYLVQPPREPFDARLRQAESNLRAAARYALTLDERLFGYAPAQQAGMMVEKEESLHADATLDRIIRATNDLNELLAGLQEKVGGSS